MVVVTFGSPVASAVVVLQSGETGEEVGPISAALIVVRLKKRQRYGGRASTKDVMDETVAVDCSKMVATISRRLGHRLRRGPCIGHYFEVAAMGRVIAVALSKVVKRLSVKTATLGHSIGVLFISVSGPIAVPAIGHCSGSFTGRVNSSVTIRGREARRESRLRY